MASAKKTCWFLGDSWVHWLKVYCEGKGSAFNLDLENVEVVWFGQRGMRWHQVLLSLQFMHSRVHPDFIIIHCGGNDLGNLRGISLIRMMKHDLIKIMELYPDSTVLFSTIAERQQWMWTTEFGPKFERARRNLNKVMSAFMRDYGMLSVRHFNICSAETSLFRHDGVHLTDRGNAFFLSNIRNAITSL